MPLVTAVVGASMIARSARSSRTITAKQFFKAPFATDLAADEMLVEVRVPRLPTGHGYSFLEVSQRFGDRALIAVGCTLTIRYGTCRDVRIGICDTINLALRVATAEAVLEGKPISATAVETVADAVTAADDLHADEAYRRDVAATLTRRMLRVACARAGRAIVE